MRPSTRFALTASLTALLTACATAPKAPPQPTWEGKANYQRLKPPANDKPYQMPSGVTATGTVLMSNPAPVYPPALVAKALPPVVVNARLSIDAEGNVAAVWISRYQGNKAHRKAFESAVRDAAMKWLFTPLVFTQKVAHGEQPPTLKSTRKPFSLYFRFHFKVVNGKPVISSDRKHS